MDNSYGAYKDKVLARIGGIIEDALSKGTITLDQAQEMGPFVLENIDLTKTNIELLEFITNLSAKWPIFNSLLTSDTQLSVAQASAQVQEKTDEAVRAAEELIKENKIDEALQVAKAAENPEQNPPAGAGGVA